MSKSPKGDDYAMALLFSVELASQHRCLLRERIHRHVRQEFLEERFTTKSYLGCLRAIDAVSEFGQTHGRERRS
jgi:hypothetical protein